MIAFLLLGVPWAPSFERLGQNEKIFLEPPAKITGTPYTSFL